MTLTDSPRPTSALGLGVLISALVVTIAAFFFGQTSLGEPYSRLLDNIHWTVAFCAAAALGWLGVKDASPGENRTRKLFAWGLTFNALGQLSWDVELVAGRDPFSPLTNILFFLLGPLMAAGLWTTLRTLAPRSKTKTAALDSISLGLGVMALVLNLYIPREENPGAGLLLLFASYPVALQGSAMIGVVLMLTLRLRLHRDWLTLVVGLMLTGIVWMFWISGQVAGPATDGSFLNIAFSLATLMLGWGAMLWRPAPHIDTVLERRFEVILRVLPLVLVMTSVVCMVLTWRLHAGSPVVQIPLILASVTVVLIAAWRQTVLVKEHDHLRHMEQQVSESERRYKTLFEAAPDAIFIMCDMAFVACNERALEMLGCDRNTVMGSSLWDFAPLSQRDGRSSVEVANSRTEEAMQGQRQSFEWLAQRADGTTFDAEISVYRIELGRRTVIQIILRDISERKKAEEALRTSESRFSRSFESAAIGMALVATDGRFIKVNAALCQMLGYCQNELMQMSFQEITHPEDLQSDLKLMQRTISGKIEGFHMEKRYFHKSGTVVHTLLSASLVRDSAGKSLHFTSQVQDMTQRKKLEEQFRQSQKMEAVGQLAGGVAHDFNNILTVIQGYATLMENGDISVNLALQEITQAVERASGLTRQLLTFSRKQIMQPRELDVNGVVENMTSMLRRTLGEHVALIVDQEEDLPAVKADQGMLEQILVNLAVNARDAMPQGGRLCIATSSTAISEEESRQHADARVGLAVCMRVSDTGCGIPAENLPRIFEPFFTTKEVNQGTGLGLATVHGIVRQHGGLIRLTSEIGKGTVFEILLPASRIPKKAQVEKPAERKAEGGHETILLVDDEPALRLVSKLALKHFGYEVLEAASGRQAVALMEKNDHRIDLLLTDMVMPEGMTGKELADELRSSRPELRVLFTSGYSVDLLNRSLALPDGVWFLPKPFTTQKLAHAVRDCLNSPPGDARLN